MYEKLREGMKEKKKVVAVSGGFDPVHFGHLELFERAKKLGDRLVVILNNDNWVLKKKEVVFMPQEERKAILQAFRAVDEVVLTEHGTNPSDMTVCDALRTLRPDIFANGGDRTNQTTPEMQLCEELGIHLAFGLGKKVQSSSRLLNEYVSRRR